MSIELTPFEYEKEIEEKYFKLYKDLKEKYIDKQLTPILQELAVDIDVILAIPFKNETEWRSLLEKTDKKFRDKYLK
jgi:hypothetical protein